MVIWFNYLASMENAALGTKSGGDTHIIEFSKKVDSLGNGVVMLTSGSGKSLLEVEDAKLKHHEIRVPFETFLLKSSLGIGLLYTLRPFMAVFARLERFDVIVTSSHYPSDVLSAFFFHLRNPKSKLVVYFHGISIPPAHGFIMRTLSIAYNYLGALMATRFCDLIFVINKPTRDFLLHFGVKDERIVLTSNGVEIPDTVSMTKEKSLDACFLGWLDKRKGIYDLIKVWKNVCTKRHDAKLAIVGIGPEKELSNKIIVDLGLEANITLHGFLSGDKKYALLKRSKIFVFPSYLESWGVAVAEAMACGLPVVAYSLPVYRDVFEDKLVEVPVGDVNAMAAKIIFLLQNPEVAKQIGEEGRNFVERYDWETVAKKELSAIINLTDEL